MKLRKWLTSPLSGQATINSMLRHHKLLACHSGAALGIRIGAVANYGEPKETKQSILNRRWRRSF